MVDLVKPSELPAISGLQSTAITVAETAAGVVGKVSPLQVVDAGAPVPTDNEAKAGVDNSKRMTPYTVRVVMEDVTAPAVLRAQAWAESATPPDPLIPTSKSAKSWAGLAEISEGEAQQHATDAATYAGQALTIKNNLLSDLQASASTLPSGASATATWNAGTQTIAFGIPAGAAGPPGAAATVTVGSTTTGAPGSSASVTNSGTSNAAILNFTVPQGPQGIQGPPGPGTVNSVGVTVPTGFAASGSPITNSGTIAISYASGYQGYTTTEATKLSGIQAGAQVNVATNLGNSPATSTLSVTSSTGTSTTLPAATTSLAGVMSAADKTKLNGIAAGAQVNTVTSVAGKTGAVTLAATDVSGLGGLATKSAVAVSDISATGTPGAGNFLRGDGSWSPASGGGGTVTSVNMSVPTGLSVSGGPVTSSGTLAVSYSTGYQGYTTAEATKLSGIEAGAEVNVQSDWSAVSGDALILNKPTLGGAAALNVGTVAGTVAAGNDSRIVNAVQTSRAITAGTGLTGGGNLSADRSLALSAGSIASLALADTAVQPSDLGDLAYLDAVGISDISATGTPGAGTFLRGDGTWSPASGGGGTVTSVAMSVPTGLSVSGSPITASGTFAISYSSGYQGYTSAEATKLSGIGAGANVASVAGKTGVVTLAKGDVGLGNVDNTSDANKPVSTAQQTALNLKLTKAGDSAIGGFDSVVHARGNSSGQNITPNLTVSNFQTITNNGAFTLTAPANGQYTIAIVVTNNATGAGTMTATGFSKVHGTFATTANLRQLLTITVIGSTKVLNIQDAS